MINEKPGVHQGMTSYKLHLLAQIAYTTPHNIPTVIALGSSALTAAIRKHSDSAGDSPNGHEDHNEHGDDQNQDDSNESAPQEDGAAGNGGGAGDNGTGGGSNDGDDGDDDRWFVVSVVHAPPAMHHTPPPFCSTPGVVAHPVVTTTSKGTMMTMTTSAAAVPGRHLGIRADLAAESAGPAAGVRGGNTWEAWLSCSSSRTGHTMPHASGCCATV